MDWVSHTVAAFGQSVGIPHLALDAAGQLLFAVEPDGLLSVHDLLPAGGDEVLVSLAQPLAMPQAACVRRALRLADFRGNTAWQAQFSMRGDALVVTLRMPRHSFMLSALEEAVETLFDLHARTAQVH